MLPSHGAPECFHPRPPPLAHSGWFISQCRARAGLAAAAAAGTPATASPGDSCVPLLEALAVDDHVVFSRIFEAAELPLNATDRYTVFVPEDGEAVKPGDAAGVAGGSGILGLFSAYAIDTRTAASIRSSPVFDQVKGAPTRRMHASRTRPRGDAQI